MGYILNRRRVMGGKASILPPGVVEVEYLYTFKDPNINNWCGQIDSIPSLLLIVNENNTVRWEGKVSYETIQNGGALITGLNDGLTHYCRIDINNAGGFSNFGINIRGLEPVTVYDAYMDINNTRIELGITINGELKTAAYTGYQGNSQSSVRFFNYTNPTSVRVGRNKWYQNNGEALDLIPVRYNGVGYFYDTISGNFYGKTGSVAIGIGPDV